MSLSIERRIHDFSEMRAHANRCRAQIDADRALGSIPHGIQVRGRKLGFSPEQVAAIVRFYWGDDIEIEFVNPQLSA